MSKKSEQDIIAEAIDLSVIQEQKLTLHNAVDWTPELDELYRNSKYSNFIALNPRLRAKHKIPDHIHAYAVRSDKNSPGLQTIHPVTKSE
jgi:hypothetical protein